MKTEEITQIQDEIGKICWIYTVCEGYDENENIIVLAQQAEIFKVLIFNGKMYYTSIGIYPEHNIAFTEIDAYRKAKEHFETVQHNIAVLIAHAEDKIKELEHKTK